MAITYLSALNIQGLSTDTKPANVPNNSIFYETDTYTFYHMVAGAWVELSQKTGIGDYHIYLAGSTIKAKNNLTGVVDYTHASDVGALTNTVITALTGGGGKITYSGDNFTINTGIVIPKAVSSATKPYILEGDYNAFRASGGTHFTVGSSFPNQGKIWSSVSANASATTSQFQIRGFSVSNQTYARAGAGAVNLAGGTTIIDAQLLDFESDTTTPGFPLIMENVYGQYMWRGIRLAGMMFWPVIRNISFNDVNTSFVGDYDFSMEKGTHAEAPKVLDLQNFITVHLSGSSAGSGSMNSGFTLSGGYHNIQNVFLDGLKYNNWVFGLKQCFSSFIKNIKITDLLSPNAGMTQGVIVLDTTDPAGTAASGGHTCFNNQITGINAAPQPVSLVFLNGAFRNRLTDVYGYWGSTFTINDTNAGIGNTIEIIDGHQVAATANTKVTQTAANVKIIDNRTGSSSRGISTQSGNASTTTFNIAHGCFTTPVDYDVRPISSDAFGAYDLSVGATNITVMYKIAPPGGTNNLKWKWIAEVYA